MNPWLRTCIIAASLGAVYGVVTSLLEDLLGMEQLGEFWDMVICMLMVVLAIAISQKMSSPSNELGNESGS